MGSGGHVFFIQLEAVHHLWLCGLGIDRPHRCVIHSTDQEGLLWHFRGE